MDRKMFHKRTLKNKHISYMRSVVWPPRGENLPAINMASCKKEVDMLIVDM